MPSSTLAQNIREARLGAGLTQEELADKVGTGRWRVIAWEQGRNQPRIKFLLQIAAVTGIGMTELLDGSDASALKRGENEVRRASA